MGFINQPTYNWGAALCIVHGLSQRMIRLDDPAEAKFDLLWYLQNGAHLLAGRPLAQGRNSKRTSEEPVWWRPGFFRHVAWKRCL